MSALTSLEYILTGRADVEYSSPSTPSPRPAKVFVGGNQAVKNGGLRPSRRSGPMAMGNAGACCPRLPSACFLGARVEGLVTHDDDHVLVCLV